MIEHFAAKAPHLRSTVAIGVLTGALALALPAEASAAITVPHAPKPEVTVPTPEPGAAPAQTPAGDAGAPSPSPVGGQDQAEGNAPRANQLGYVDTTRQPALALGQVNHEVQMAKEFGNAITSAPTPMVDAEPLSLNDALVLVGLDVDKALTSSDPSGQSDIVMDVIAKAFSLIGSTACSKETAAEGKPAICPN